MTVKVFPKYQVVIPQDVRRFVDVKPGMEVNILSKGGVIYIVSVKTSGEVSKTLEKKFLHKPLKNYREKKDRKI